MFDADEGTGQQGILVEQAKRPESCHRQSMSYSTITTRNMARKAALEEGDERQDAPDRVLQDTSNDPGVVESNDEEPADAECPEEEERCQEDPEPRSPSSSGSDGEYPPSSSSDAESSIEGEESALPGTGEHGTCDIVPIAPVPGKGGRGRKSADDGVEKPDFSSLSPARRVKAEKDFRRAKNNAAQRRLRQRRKEAQGAGLQNTDICDAADGVSKLTVSYPVLAEMGNSGEVSRLLKLGTIFHSKRELVVCIRSVAEFLGRVDIAFVKSDSGVIAVHSESSREDFSLEAIYYISTNLWKVIRSRITTRKGTRPPGKGPMTAYQERDLAGMLRPILKANPGEQVKPLRHALKPFLRFAEDIKDNQIFRARPIALEDLFGRPGDNIRLLPVIKYEFERAGHRFGYKTIDKGDMSAVLESVAESEYRREAKQIRKKPATSRTPAEIQACRPWRPDGKQAWEQEQKTFLSTIKEGSRYVELVWFAFSHSLIVQPTLLFLVNADAAHGKRFLDCFQLFVVVGFTSNMNIVPLLYVYLCGNESTNSWSRVFNILKKLYPALRTTREMTFLTDQEKGLQSALNFVLKWIAEDGETFVPKQMVCLHHRSRNLAVYGKRAVTLFRQLATAPTLAAINAIKDSATFRQLSDVARSAIGSLADEHQFLAVAASCGAQTYGKTTSQAVESQNSHLLKARALDLVSSIFEISALETDRYNKHYSAAHSHEGLLTPWARSKLSTLKQVGDDVNDITNPDALSTNTTRTFVVVEHSGRRNTVKLVNLLSGEERFSLQTDSDEKTLFSDGIENAACSCGLPLRDRFPCNHMLTVARVFSLPEEMLVPPEFLVSRWKRQYPEDLAFRVPTKIEIEMSVVPGDEQLALPMVCPPKRGRPNKKRIKSAVELAKKRCRRNASTDVS